jgi:hypothetical protein
MMERWNIGTKDIFEMSSGEIPGGSYVNRSQRYPYPLQIDGEKTGTGSGPEPLAGLQHGDVASPT